MDDAERLSVDVRETQPEGRHEWGIRVGVFETEPAPTDYPMLNEASARNIAQPESMPLIRRTIGPWELVEDDAETTVPEFWVINDRREGPAIWWWDGTTITLLIHQNDVIYGSAGGFAVRRAARSRLWERIIRDIPVAPTCQQDGCDEAAVTHPTHCPAHLPEETP